VSDPEWEARVAHFTPCGNGDGFGAIERFLAIGAGEGGQCFGIENDMRAFHREFSQ
jgi:hypothetical protein